MDVDEIILKFKFPDGSSQRLLVTHKDTKEVCYSCHALSLRAHCETSPQQYMSEICEIVALGNESHSTVEYLPPHSATHWYDDEH